MKSLRLSLTIFAHWNQWWSSARSSQRQSLHTPEVPHNGYLQYQYLDRFITWIFERASKVVNINTIPSFAFNFTVSHVAVHWHLHIEILHLKVTWKLCKFPATQYTLHWPQVKTASGHTIQPGEPTRMLILYCKPLSCSSNAAPPYTVGEECQQGNIFELFWTCRNGIAMVICQYYITELSLHSKPMQPIDSLTGFSTPGKRVWCDVSMRY